MPSEVDQAVSPQSIQDRLGGFFQGEAPEKAPSVAKQPAVDVAEDDTETDQVEEGDEEEITPEPEPTVDEVEVELEGWKGKIPTKLKAEIDKGADYTRKTQTLADEKRLLDANIRSQQEYVALQQAASAEIEQLTKIRSQLEQYSNVDITQVDGDTINRMRFAADNLKDQAAKLEKAVSVKQNEFRVKVLGSWDELATKAQAVIVRDIPNWSSVAPDVAKFALNEGYQYEHITGHDRQSGQRVGPGVVDPVFAKTLYKAMQWDKLQASKATSSGKVANAPPVLKPGAQTITKAAHTQKALSQQHKQRGSVDTAAALLRKYFKD
jgi:hypothetical protein